MSRAHFFVHLLSSGLAARSALLTFLLLLISSREGMGSASLLSAGQINTFSLFSQRVFVSEAPLQVINLRHNVMACMNTRTQCCPLMIRLIIQPMLIPHMPKLIMPSQLLLWPIYCSRLLYDFTLQSGVLINIAKCGFSSTSCLIYLLHKNSSCSMYVLPFCLFPAADQTFVCMSL